MYIHAFQQEAALRREISQLQQRVADLMDIQIRAELYRDKVLSEFAQLEDENSFLKSAIDDLRWQLAQIGRTINQPRVADVVFQAQPLETAA